MNMGRYLISALFITLTALIALAVPAAMNGQNARTPSARSRQAYYLGWQFERLRADAARIVVLTGRLQKELDDDSGTGTGMSEDIEGRVKALEQSAQELFSALRETSRNQLSYEIVQMAAAIEAEGKSLRKAFEKLTPGDRRKTFRGLANKIRKKAESVRKKMRMP